MPIPLPAYGSLNSELGLFHAMRIIALLLVISAALTRSVIAQAATEAPVSTLSEYRAALKKGDLARAVALTASFPKLPSEGLREITQKYLDMMSSGRLRIWFYPESLRVIGDCAVMVVGDHQRPAPDDPCYFLNQGGQWKVLPKLTDWQESYFEFTDTQKQAFVILTAHYEAEQKRLRSKANPEADAK